MRFEQNTTLGKQAVQWDNMVSLDLLMEYGL